MNITILVGNGFDIAAGLKTSYIDFYDWYCKTPSLPDNDDSETIKNFKQDIFDKKSTSWSDFELGLGDYTKNFTLDTSKQFSECYEDAHNQMVKFLEKEEGRYSKDLITDDAINLFCDGILNFYQELSPKEERFFKEIMKKDEANSSIIQFISFNYTNILDIYVETAVKKRKVLKEWRYHGTRHEIKINPTVLHIHGRKDYYPIMGVSEETYIANPEILQDSNIRCSLVKENSVDRIGEVWYDDAKSQIDKSRIICVFGMSLGQSDSSWWRKIITWLSKDQNRQLIVFWYSTDAMNTISFVSLNEAINSVINILLSYGGIPSSSDIQGRIHIVLNAKKMLTVPIVDSQEQEKPENESVHK